MLPNNFPRKQFQDLRGFTAEQDAKYELSIGNVGLGVMHTNSPDEYSVDVDRQFKRLSHSNAIMESRRNIPVDGVVQPPVHPPTDKRTRNTNQLEYVSKTLLRAIMNHRYSWPFLKPVNAVELGIPDYHEIIKEPMDFNTIKERLENRFYFSAKECLGDIQRVFNNCFLYNNITDDCAQMGLTLQKVFCAGLAKMPFEEIEIPANPSKRKLQTRQKGRKTRKGCRSDENNKKMKASSAMTISVQTISRPKNVLTSKNAMREDISNNLNNIKTVVHCTEDNGETTSAANPKTSEQINFETNIGSYLKFPNAEELRIPGSEIPITLLTVTPPSSPNRPIPGDSHERHEEVDRELAILHHPSTEDVKDDHLNGPWFGQKADFGASKINSTSGILKSNNFQKFRDLARSRIEKERILDEKRRVQREQQKLLEEKAKANEQENKIVYGSWSLFPTPPFEPCDSPGNFCFQDLRRIENEKRKRIARESKCNLLKQRDTMEEFENYLAPADLLPPNKKYNLYSKYSWEKKSFVCEWVEEVRVPYNLN